MFNVCEFFSQKTANRGISADTTSGLINRIDSSILDINGKKMFLLIGTNDISEKVPLDTILKNIEEIILTTKKKSLKWKFL